MLDAVKRALPEVDIVVVSDYGKGVCNDTVCHQVISASAGQGKKVIIDPKGTNWEKYRSATIITPKMCIRDRTGTIILIRGNASVFFISRNSYHNRKVAING